MKELGSSQHNLDQLRTLELLKESIWSIFHHVVHHISTCSISRLQIVWSVHFGWPPPTPHSRVHGMDLWVRCPDACMRPGIQCTTKPGPNTRRSTLSPTSTLAHRLVVIYWASSRLARSPKFPLHNAQRPSHSAPHTRPTVCRMASKLMLGQTLGKADQHVTNTGDGDLRSICAHLLAPTCSSNSQSQYPTRTAGNNSW